MAFNPVPAQLTVHVRWPTHPDDAEFTLDSVVAGLGMSDMDCDINSLVIPASTPSHRVLTPPLELLPNSWVPWDTSLSESRRFHLVFLDRQLYADTVELANTIQATMDWVPTACAEWSHTYIELTLLNHAEMVELQARQFTTIQGLQNQIILWFFQTSTCQDLDALVTGCILLAGAIPVIRNHICDSVYTYIYIYHTIYIIYIIYI